MSEIEMDSDGQQCTVHGRPLEYFCSEDQVAICSRCYIMGAHKGHNIESFEEKNKLIIASLENGIVTATVVYNKLSKLDKTFVSSKLKVEKAKLVEQITHSFSRMHNVLRRREQEILSEIDTIYNEQISISNGLVENGKNDKQRLGRALTDSKSLLENQSLIVDGDSLLNTISSAPHIPCIVSELTSPHITWDETHIGDIVEAMRTFGSVKNDKEESIRLKTVEEAPETIEEADKILRVPILHQKSCDAYSVSSTDTGEDVVIESDPDSITTTISSVSTHSSDKQDLVLPQVKGQCKQVIVTHIRSPNDFYVQLLMNKENLGKLSQRMNAWCRKKSSAQYVPNILERGMLVLACYSEDKQWYRARVLDVDVSAGDGGLKAHIMYFDFGNEERLPLKSLRKMEPRFSRCPPFCCHCSLHDITPLNKQGEWESHGTQEFFRLTRNQILLLNVIGMKGHTYEVDLICTPAEDVLDDQFSSVRDMLIFLELAKFARPSQPAGKSKSYKTVNYYKPTPMAHGDVVGVTVAEALSPSNFYITFNGEENIYYLNMMEEMKQAYANDGMGLYMMHCPRKDTVCVVKGPDNKWHRGKIVSEPKHSKVTVFLVDIGSTLVVQCDKVQKMLSDFIKLPAQAIYCRLADVDYTDQMLEDWSDDAKTWCCTDLKGSQGMVRIVRWGEQTEVVMWMSRNTSGPSVNSLLVEAGLAVSKGPSSMLPVAAQDKTKGKKDNIGGNMVLKNQAVSSDRSQSPTKKTEQQLYRPPSASSSPATSPSKKISAPSSSLSPSKTAAAPKTKSSTSVAQGPTSAKSIKEKKTNDKRRSRRRGDPSKSEEEEEEEESKKVSAGNSFASAAETARKKKVQENIHKAMGGGDGQGSVNAQAGGESIYIEILVTSYESPTDFFIRVQEQEGALLDLMQDLNREYKTSEVVPDQKWKAEDFCVVRCSGDDSWYRAKINCVLSATDVEVELLDYGSTLHVPEDELRPLLPELGTRLNRAAVRCHLAGLIPTGSSDRTKWTKTATEFMENTIKKKKLYIKTEGEPDASGLPIDIIIEEEIPETAFDPVTYTYHSLREKIVDNGLAMFDKPRRRNRVSTSSSQGEKEEISTGVERISSEIESTSEESKSSDSARIRPGEVELPPYEIPDLNAEIEIIPTFVDFSGVIYAQRADWDDKVSHLAEELQRVYKDSPPCRRKWSLGDVCVAFFKDDEMWYRGLIEEITRDKAKVFYVDFGNSAWVDFDQFRDIQAPFVEYPVQVYHCVLGDLMPNTMDGQWPVALLDIIHEMVVNCQCTMVYTGMMDNGHLKIKLHKPDGFDLSTYLIDSGYTVSVMDLKDQYDHSKAIGAALSGSGLCRNADVGGDGSIFHALATEVELPNVVYVQRMRLEELDIHDFVRSAEIAAVNNEIDHFEDMMAAIKTTPSAGFIQLPDPGMMCLAKYHFDNSWYRALCVKKHPEVDSCLMVFIDYGTSEIVTKDALRSLPTQFWDLPSQAIRCHLNLVPPGGPSAVWRKNSLDAMVAALNQKTLAVKVVQTSPLMVELFVESDSGGLSLAYEEMIQKGLAWLPMHINADMLMLGGDGVGRNSDDVEVEVEEEEEVVESKNKDTNNSCVEVYCEDVVIEQIDDWVKAVIEEEESSSGSGGVEEEEVVGGGGNGKGLAIVDGGDEEDVEAGGGDDVDGEDGWATASDEEGSAV